MTNNKITITTKDGTTFVVETTESVIKFNENTIKLGDVPTSVGVEEFNEFKIQTYSISNKIYCIKAVREATGLSLLASKRIVENAEWFRIMSLDKIEEFKKFCIEKCIFFQEKR